MTEESLDDFAAEIDQAVARNIKRARERIGWSQDELASRLTDMGVTGVHQTTIARIEGGQRSLRVAEAIALARLLEYRVEELAESAGTGALREMYRTLQTKVVDFQKSAKELIQERARVALKLDQKFPYADDDRYAEVVLSKTSPAVYEMLDELLYSNSAPSDLLNTVYYSARSDPLTRAFTEFEPWVLTRAVEVYEDVLTHGYGAVKIHDRSDAPAEEFERVLARFEGEHSGEHQEAP